VHPRGLEQFVLDNSHDYFHPLRELVKEWFHLLALAHEFHAFEYYDIHGMVLEIFDHALPSNDINEAVQKVLDDRKANIEKLGWNPFRKVQQLPPLHTSPSSQTQGQVAQAARYCPPSSPTPAPKKKRGQGQKGLGV